MICTYVNPQKGKNYDIVDQLLSGLKDNGRLVIMDSGFPIIHLLKDARLLWETHIIATQHGNMKHLPKGHKENSFINLSFLHMKILVQILQLRF